MQNNETLLKTYPLHENEPDSFGAICGGEATILIEPLLLREALYVVGAGHCAHAIVRLAVDCGLFVNVIEDRAELLGILPAPAKRIESISAADFIAGRRWQPDEGIVIVSRNHELDRAALASALRTTGAGYIGMIGSRRKVEKVFAALREQGVADGTLRKIYAPIGIDIGADSPIEIAVSVSAEVLAVLRKTGEKNLSSLRVKTAR